MAPAPEERIEWRRSRALPAVEVLAGEHVTRRFRFFHETYTVCSMLDISGGECRWAYRGRRYSARAGGLALMEPGEVHVNTHAMRPCKFRALFVPPALMQRAASELSRNSAQTHLKLAHTQEARLFRAFAALHFAMESEASALEAESRLAACIGLLLAHCAESPATAATHAAPAGLRRARDLIREHYSRPLSLDDVASAAGLSRFHVAREFTRRFGLPPHAYRIHVQVEKARALLAKGIAPVTVAAETGFADQSHFGRHFKRVTGVTPAQYQRGG